MDKTKLIENAQRLLATRQASLKDTLEEIAFLEATQASTPSSGIAAAIAQARTKRDRQHNACLASEGLIAALLSGKVKTK